MTPPADALAASMQDELERLDALIQASPVDQQPALRAAAEKLRIALEELHVVEEELRQQNEELLATRDELDAESRRYRELYELAPDGYLVTDLNGMIQEANGAAGELLRVPPSRLVGKPLSVFVAAEDQPAFRNHLAEAAEMTASRCWDLRFQPRGGGPFPAAATVAVHRDAAGQPTGWRWLVRDVSEQERLEETLRESEARFRGTFENAAVGMAHVSLEGRFVRVNDRLCTITGYTRQELLKKTFQEITHPDDVAEDVRQADRLRRGELSRYGLEKRYLRKDGSPVWVQLYGSVLRDGGGAPVCYVAVIQDICERKQLEEELRSSWERYVLAESIAHFGTWERNVEGGTTVWSPECFRIFGRDPSLGPPSFEAFLEQVLPDDRERVRSEVGRVQAEKSLLDVVYRISLPDGQARVIRSVARPRGTGAAKAATLLGVLQDVTEATAAGEALREARNAAEAAAAAKSQFLANMSHEIRTPLTGVLGMNEVLSGTRLDPEQRECVDAIRLSGKLLLGIVNDILDLSKIEAVGVRLEAVAFELRAAIEDTVHLQAEAAHVKGLELCCLVGKEVPAQVVGDPGRLRQVLFNLVGNAIKFTERGKVVVRTEVATTGGKRAAIRVEVADTGIGIPMGSQEHLFQSFSQIDASSARRYGGSGLGLAISKRLVEAMGGEIGFTSERGRGSTFWFTVPFAASSGPQEVHALPALAGTRALVVMAHETSREFLVEQLARLGAAVQGAADRAEAVRLEAWARKAKSPFGLALLDLDLPDGSGLALAQEWSERRLDGAAGIILLAPFTSRGLAAKAAEEDGFCFLLKPVRERDLGRCAEALLGGRKALSALPPLHPEVGTARGAVLVAEDNAVNQLVLTRFLERLGYAVEVVADGAAAVQRVLEQAYVLVLMDWQMPALDGLEATREIRRREDPERRVPIVGLTAHALGEHRDQCLAAGMDDFLSKPVDFEDLGRVLERWTGGQSEVGSDPRGEAGFDRVARRIAEFEERLGTESIRGIVDLFLGQGPERLDALRAAVERGDVEEVARQAHQLRGTCCHLGTERILEVAGGLERRAEAGDLSSAPAQLTTLEREWRALQEFLKARWPAT
jgi:PAS domain S-box-containing protein